MIEDEKAQDDPTTELGLVCPILYNQVLRILFILKEHLAILLSIFKDIGFLDQLWSCSFLASSLFLDLYQQLGSPPLVACLKHTIDKDSASLGVTCRHSFLPGINGNQLISASSSSLDVSTSVLEILFFPCLSASTCEHVKKVNSMWISQHFLSAQSQCSRLNYCRKSFNIYLYGICSLIWCRVSYMQ